MTPWLVVRRTPRASPLLVASSSDTATIRSSRSGDAGNINLIGWTGDYGDPDDFLGVFFQGNNPQFGFQSAPLTALLNKAEQETNMKTRIKEYQQANEMIMRDIVPGVPYANSIPALGFQKAVGGYIASPIGTDPFAQVTLGGQ